MHKKRVMRVYQFLEKHWAMESLLYQRLKISLFNEMNDPFELLGVSLKKKADRADFNQLKKEVSEEMGAVCFSKKWSSPVLWSHYGERHKGVALGFDVPAEHVHEISYTGSRLEEELIKGFEEEKDDLSLKLLTTKYEHWIYEDEVRMLINLSDTVYEEGKHFLPYCDALKLKEVIIGPRCNLTKEHLLQISLANSHNIKITKSRLAFQSFKVVPNRRYK